MAAPAAHNVKSASRGDGKIVSTSTTIAPIASNWRAAPATERHWIDWSPFSYPFNMTRQPAASIPCGLTGTGLPIGLQIVGPLYADARVLRAARAIETTQPERRPPLAP